VAGFGGAFYGDVDEEEDEAAGDEDERYLMLLETDA
jgi:hypothetical protein